MLIMIDRVSKGVASYYLWSNSSWSSSGRSSEGDGEEAEDNNGKQRFHCDEKGNKEERWRRSLVIFKRYF